MITPIARLSYPAIFEPKLNLSGVLKYSCSLLIPKTDVEGVRAVQAAIDKAIKLGIEKIWGGKKPKFRYEPLRDGDAELASGEKTGKEYAGHFFLNATSNDAPGVVGKDAKPLMDQKIMYAGCYVRADINPFPYDNSGNKGIGWGLNNLMFIKDGERFDGRQNAEDAFAGLAQAESADAAPEGESDGLM